MTIQSETARADYDGNGVTVDHPVPFRFLDKTHLRVVRSVIATGVETDLVLDSAGADGFTVTGAGLASGGEVTVVTPAAGAGPGQERITILRNVPAVQMLDFIANDAFPAESHERGLDWLTMLHGQQGEVLDRAMVLPVSTTGFSTSLPAPVALAPLVVNAGRTAFEMGSTDLTGDMLLRGHLAAAIPAQGASLVTTIQPGDNAVARTVSSKLNEYMSVLDYIPEALHADIRAFTSTVDVALYVQNAIYQAAAQGKELRVPHGRYMLGVTLYLPDRTVIRGAGWSVPYSGGVPQAPQGTVFKLKASANCDVFRQAGKATRYSVHLSGFAIDGDGANQGNVGNTPDGTYGMYQFNRNAFFFEALYNAVFSDLFVYNMRGAGWAFHGDGSVGMTNVFLRDCHSYNCRTYSIYCEGSVTDFRVIGGDYGFGRVSNLRLTNSATVVGAVFWTSQCQDPTDANTHSTGTGAVINGGIIIAGDGNKITGCRSEGNAGHGVKCVGSFNKLSDSTLYFNSSTAGTSGLFDGINDAGADNIWEDVEIRQSPSSTHALRKAIRLEGAHSNTRIMGGTLRRVGANGALVAEPVQGFSFSGGDRSDFSWANSLVEAHSTVANSIGTTPTIVVFNNEVTDTGGEYDPATGRYTAAAAKTVKVEFDVTIANVTDGNSFLVEIFVNGATYRRFGGQQRAGAASPIAIQGFTELKLAAGDIVDIRGTCGTATNTSLGATITWLRIEANNG